MLLPVSIFAAVSLFPDAVLGSLPYAAFHIPLPWFCLASSRGKRQRLKCTHHIFLPLQGPYTLAAAAAPGRTDPPYSPHRVPILCGNRGNRRQGHCSELEEPAGQAPQLECTARGPGREKALGHCDPLSQTPWGALSSESPSWAQKT